MRVLSRQELKGMAGSPWHLDVHHNQGGPLHGEGVTRTRPHNVQMPIANVELAFYLGFEAGRCVYLSRMIWSDALYTSMACLVSDSLVVQGPSQQQSEELK